MPNLPLPEGTAFRDLGVVMIETEPLPSLEHMGLDAKKDLFYGEGERLKFAQGAVGEKGGHVTLIFGVHPMSGRREAVKAVLGKWNPEPVEIEEVSHFPGVAEGSDYNVIIAKVKKTINLRDARARLETLPFNDKHPDYTPHITIAYINGDADVDKWVDTLNKVYKGKKFDPEGLTIK